MASDNANSPLAVNLGTEIVDIYVGKDRKHYVVHKKLLTSRSDYFDKALNGRFKEAEENAIHLEEEDPAAIELLIGWLYTGTIPGTKELSNPFTTTSRTKKTSPWPGESPSAHPLSKNSIDELAREHFEPEPIHATSREGLNFQPVFTMDNLVHICFQSKFKEYSPEELRYIDYSLLSSQRRAVTSTALFPAVRYPPGTSGTGPIWIVTLPTGPDSAVAVFSWPYTQNGNGGLFGGGHTQSSLRLAAEANIGGFPGNLYGNNVSSSQNTTPAGPTSGHFGPGVTQPSTAYALFGASSAGPSAVSVFGHNFGLSQRSSATSINYSAVLGLFSNPPRRHQPPTPTFRMTQSQPAGPILPGIPRSSSTELDQDSLQLAVLKLCLLADKVCWDTLFNIAITTYIALCRFRPVAPSHIDIIYTHSYPDSPLRQYVLDSISLIDPVDEYIEVATKNPDFLEEAFEKVNVVAGPFMGGGQPQLTWKIRSDPDSAPFTPYMEPEPNTNRPQMNAFQSIAFHEQHRDMSHEELRLADYASNLRYGASGRSRGIRLRSGPCRYHIHAEGEECEEEVSPDGVFAKKDD